MTSRPPVCLKCGGQTIEGFVVEVARTRAFPNTWVQGAPERHYLRGLKLGDRITLPVTTYRCVACGYLESYAREDPKRKPITVSALRKVMKPPK